MASSGESKASTATPWCSRERMSKDSIAEKTTRERIDLQVNEGLEFSGDKPA
jgi:hypothetical protein